MAQFPQRNAQSYVTYPAVVTAEDRKQVRLLARSAKNHIGKPKTNPSNGSSMGTKVSGGGRISGGRG